MFKVDYHWDRLKTCVVGRAYPPEHFSWVADPKIRSALERIMIETEEDFQQLIKLLESFGVTVIRPLLNEGEKFKKPLVTPRDHMAMIGEIFYCDVEFNKTEIATILNVVATAGNKIVREQGINSAIVNRVGRNLYFGIPNKMKLIASSLALEKKIKLDNNKIENLIGLLDRQKNYVNDEIDRIKKLLTDYHCHFVEGTEGHIDGTISLIKPGLLLLANDDEKLISSCKDHWPGWEIVAVEGNDRLLHRKFEILKTANGGRWWVPGEEQNFALSNFVDTYLSEWVGFVSETYFEINTLMIDQNNALCMNFTDKILDAYSRHGVTPHQVVFRHSMFWDGGIHCITADLDRGD